MDRFTLLIGIISATTNLSVGGLFLAFWLYERSARWNQLWAIAHAAIAAALVIWLVLHRIDTLPLLVLASLLGGLCAASLLAGVNCFLGEQVSRRGYSGWVAGCAAIIFLAGHFGQNAPLICAVVIFCAVYGWGGARFLLQPDAAVRGVGGLFVARALQLALFVPLTISGHGAIAFITGHFMSLATGFGLLFIGFVDHSRRLQLARQEMASQNTILTARDQELTDANQLLADMTVLLELKNTEYAEARDRAQAANQAKSQFLANMSHELRTPLNAIIGFSDLILAEDKPGVPQQTLEYSGYIRDAGRQLYKIVSDLLDIARIELNAIELIPELFRLRSPLESALTILRFALNSKQISVEIDIPEALEITADSRLIRQVLTNLISNAIKFSPLGGTILVSARTTAEAGLSLSVIDSGPGIAQADREHVFERFWQKSNVMTRDHGGIGLGLSIVRQIIEAHNGTIHIEDGPSGGTALVIELPNGESLGL